jgi:hypothetical protein
MRRSLPILVGLLLVLGAGAVHGLWTRRWLGSGELARAAGRLGTLPDSLGAWQGEAGAVN